MYYNKSNKIENQSINKLTIYCRLIIMCEFIPITNWLDIYELSLCRSRTHRANRETSLTISFALFIVVHRVSYKINKLLLPLLHRSSHIILFFYCLSFIRDPLSCNPLLLFPRVFLSIVGTKDELPIVR